MIHFNCGFGFFLPPVCRVDGDDQHYRQDCEREIPAVERENINQRVADQNELDDGANRADDEIFDESEFLLARNADGDQNQTDRKRKIEPRDIVDGRVFGDLKK